MTKSQHRQGRPPDQRLAPDFVKAKKFFTVANSPSTFISRAHSHIRLHAALRVSLVTHILTSASPNRKSHLHPGCTPKEKTPSPIRGCDSMPCSHDHEYDKIFWWPRTFVSTVSQTVVSCISLFNHVMHSLSLSSHIRDIHKGRRRVHDMLKVKVYR